LETAQWLFSFLVSANIFSPFKLFANAIIDETGMYWPVGIEHDGLCRQRKEQDGGKEGAGDADLWPELPASLSPELPSGLLPKKRIAHFLLI
jgi:hypothetical protein